MNPGSLLPGLGLGRGVVMLTLTTMRILTQVNKRLRRNLVADSSAASLSESGDERSMPHYPEG